MKTINVSSTSSITVSTQTKKKAEMQQWWTAGSDKDLKDQLLSTVGYLKETQTKKQRDSTIFARLYGNQNLYNIAGNSVKGDQLAAVDRPTYNLISSATDTLTAKITQSRPAPVFLTDNGDYKERNLAKKLNNFILGEFYQTKTYEKASIMFRDACVLGTGVLKVYRTQDDKVGLERVLITELFVDNNEAMYGEPRRLYQLKLVDREVLKGMFPSKKAAIDKAENSFPDNSSESSRTVADLVMVAEAWSLPSFPGAKDGRHSIVCSEGIICDEDFTKDKFPLVFMHYAPRMTGFWAQGLAERLMGTQVEINSILYTIAKAIKLVGVPRIFIEKGSKVTKASFNNEVGTIIEYSGVKPIYEVAQCVPGELYQERDRLIDYGYRQEGISSLDASAQKPAGLDSGEAIRSFDDISNDRTAAISRRYDNVFVDLAYLIIDEAKSIAEETGSYATVYPNKNGTKEIDLPKMSLLQDPFVIQCFNMSSLPRDPAGRMAKITEMIQSGMITIKEGRRLLDYPDLDQVEKLANASEERIFKYLDDIIEDGDQEDFEFHGPDPFMDLELAEDTVVQYYNLYAAANLEPEKIQMLQDFFTQIQGLKQAAMPPAPPAPMPGAPGAAPGGQPQLAQAEPLPTSPLIPQGAAAA